jgi:hypothetical protein
MLDRSSGTDLELLIQVFEKWLSCAATSPKLMVWQSADHHNVFFASSCFTSIN